MIYFVQCADTDWVKVGFATTLGSRVSSLNTATPHNLTLLATVPGTRQDELRFHRLLSKHRGKGEWFKHAGVVKIALALAQERYSLEHIYEIIEAYNETDRLRLNAAGAKGTVARKRRILADIGTGRHHKRHIATNLPTMRKQATAIFNKYIRAKRALRRRIYAVGRTYA